MVYKIYYMAIRRLQLFNYILVYLKKVRDDDD